ncbi:Fe-S cluster assembly protein SufD [Candidatus Woesearchaeota archaeon]|nr:Fe-S cluster assembly protein SufD [Candidatus Woesearchaeota archaeon]
MAKQLPLPQLKYGLTTYLSLDEFSPEKVAKVEITYTPYGKKGTTSTQLQDLREFWQTPRGKAIFQILKKQPTTQIEDIQDQALQQGIAIIIPANTTLANSFLLQKHCTTTIDADTLIIIAEKNSKASIVETITSTDNCYLRTQRLHIILEDNAEVSYCSIQNLNKQKYNFVNKTANTGRNAKIYWIDGCFGSVFTSSMIHTTLTGEASVLEADTMFFAQQSQQFDLAVETNHHAPHTISDMRTKGVGKDQSKTVYRGNIKIHERAHNSNGYQKEDTLILSDEATVDAIPKLEIDNHDVRCKHGATIGQIDREKLFYLTSRGLSEGEAQATIVRGFFTPTIQKIHADELRTRLEEEIEEKTAFLMTP